MDEIIDQDERGGVIELEGILELLPHRYPFLLVDRVDKFDLECGAPWLQARKNVTFNEPFFTGHFPGRPIMPGVLMIEAMAQAGGLLMKLKIPETTGIQVLLKVDNVKFRRTVVPGDCLKMHVVLKKVRGKIAVIEAKGYVDENVVTEAEITYSVFDN